MYVTPYVNTGTDSPPALSHHINLFSVVGLPASVEAPRMKMTGMSSNGYRQIKSDGFDGVQSHLLLNPSRKKSKESGLSLSAAGIVSVANVEGRVRKWKKQGYQCATIMIGSGEECLEEALAIVATVQSLSERYHFPIYLELHRGTVTQDIDIVLEIIKAYPGVRFNADFSHYITTYRWSETFTKETQAYIQPILARVCYMHLRPANSSHIQIASPDDNDLALLKMLLSMTFLLFQRNASKGDVLIVAPELLPAITGYSQMQRSERGHYDGANRYAQSVALRRLADECFEQASTLVEGVRLASESSKACVKDTEAPCITIKTPEDWAVLEQPRFAHAERIRVLLGDSSVSQYRYEELISSYLMEQSKDRRLCLETKRNTLTHDDKRTVALQRCYPEIQLSLNIGEWVLGKEITVGQLGKIRASTRQLRNIRVINPVFATGEHEYDGRMVYKKRAWLSLSVIMERIYTRFYRKLWDTISAPKLPTH